jgi:N-acetylneuraminic acid mutarotase
MGAGVGAGAGAVGLTSRGNGDACEEDASEDAWALAESSRADEEAEMATSGWDDDDADDPNEAAGAALLAEMAEERLNLLEHAKIGARLSRRHKVSGRMEEGRADADGVVYNDRLYLVAGYCQNSSCRCTVEVYFFQAKRWEMLESEILVDRSAHIVAEHAGILHMIGGCTSQDETVSDMEVLDLNSGPSTEWGEGSTNMIVPRSLFSSVVHEGKLYAIGGQQNFFGNEPGMTSIEAYDFVAKTWELLDAVLPTSRCDPAATTYKGVVYIVGGKDVRGISTNAVAEARCLKVDAYNFASGEWSQLEGGLSTVRWGCTATVHGHRMYVVGGKGGGANKDRSEWVWNTMDVYNFHTRKWSVKQAPPRYSHVAAVYDNTLYLAGGQISIGANWNTAGDPTMAAIPLPLPYLWSVLAHPTFPLKFRTAVHVVMLCGVRLAVLPDELMVLIMAMFESHDFTPPMPWVTAR